MNEKVLKTLEYYKIIKMLEIYESIRYKKKFRNLKNRVEFIEKVILRYVGITVYFIILTVISHKI